MLLDKYKGKNVKILVSSNSGAGTGTGTGSGISSVVSSVSSIIVCGGILTDYDDSYIEISNVKMLRPNTWYFSGNGEPTRVDEYNQTLISQKSIISISVVEE